MAVATATAILVGAAVVAGGATAYSAQQSGEQGRRAETRAKGLANEESIRQKKQGSLIAEQEATQNKQIAGRLRSTAGTRAGRRSLIFNPAQQQADSNLGSQATLG